MKKREKSLIGTSIPFVLAGALLMASVPTTHGAAPPQDVTVVNTPAQAVPVSFPVTPTVNAQQFGMWAVGLTAGSIVGLAPGTVVGLVSGTLVGIDPDNNLVKAQQDGTWTVEIAGTPTVQLAPGTSVGVTGPVTVDGVVGVSGTVSVQGTVDGTVGLSTSANTVKLDQTNSNNVVRATQNGTWNVFVRDVDEPGRQFFQRYVVMVIPEGSQVIRQQFQVPADQVLVIEYASAHGQLPIGMNQIIGFGIATTTATGAGGVQHELIAIRHSENSFKASQPIRLYSPPGGIVQVEAVRDGGTAGNASVTMAFSGYLVSP